MKNVKIRICYIVCMCFFVLGIISISQTVRAENTNFVIKDGELQKYTGNEANVVIPNGVKRIWGSAFKDNTSIVSVSIPEGVTYIGAYAFENCKNLKEISVPDSLKEMGYYVFDGTAWLENKQNERTDHLVIINNKILYEGKKSTGAIQIPEGITMICPYAFYYNDKITKIIVPKSVQICDSRCFGGCTSLKEITFKNKNAKMNFDLGRVKTSSGAIGAFYAGDYWEVMLFEDGKKPCTMLTIKGYSGSTAEKAAKELVKLPWGNQQVRFVNLKTGKAKTYGIPPKLTIKKGKTSKKLKVNYINGYNGIVKFAYKSKNPQIAEISKNGILTAKKKGKTTCTVTIRDKFSEQGLKRVFKVNVIVK